MQRNRNGSAIVRNPCTQFTKRVQPVKDDDVGEAKVPESKQRP